MCVGILYTVDVSIPSHSLFNNQSIKGSLLSSSDSMVYFIEGLTKFKRGTYKGKNEKIGDVCLFI